jgi:hypothetical protein
MSSLSDTAANQAAYPQPGSQKPELGFPLCRMVSIICLGSGAVLDMACGPCKGKGNDEQTLLRSMLDTLQADDILLGDAFYATCFLLCALKDKGVDGVFDLMAQRQVGKRPRRIEPRVVKRRPKPFPLLTRSRAAGREEIRKNGHPKKLK